MNIYTPAADNRKRPVLFWIHGGAFIMGSGHDYNGSVLAEQGDVVVVTINYRLDCSGFWICLRTTMSTSDQATTVSQIKSAHLNG